MSQKTDISEERRAQILEAATKVYVRSGLEKARMNDIAEEAGLAKGTLYLYFASKHDLMLSILDMVVDRELHEVHELLGGERSAKEKLIKFSEYWVNEVENMESVIPILFEFWGAMSHQEVVKEKLAEHYQSLVDTLVPIIQQGIDEYDFYRVDTRAAAVALEAILEGTLLLWTTNPEMVDFRMQIGNSMQLMLKGMEVR